MISLKPMNAVQYVSFEQWLIKDYAEDKIKAGAWTAEEALQRSQESIRQHLPAGLETKDAYLYAIVLNEDGTELQIGNIWFNITRHTWGTEAFLLEIVIFEEHRGKGYGRQTMAALDEEARRVGVSRIGLHVFGHNDRALHLYKAMGYTITDIQMRKEL
ncbi:GNAT family N-acetyltransferase [Paenibacillus sp. P96]|uniref:GNAT family N-acetyltransferase n=1 Tax=Paenibacillus zeirhizosphaerae TaxID=2987519 RepID=A0ABT9FN14_9BACL|nr:GNAT family N-acetyltransferase [Paenibacillus sp. P96]MDP4096115.1 GNAT family N-acetyltransferase [Paenibacillus sp. P96]